MRRRLRHLALAIGGAVLVGLGPSVANAQLVPTPMPGPSLPPAMAPQAVPGAPTPLPGSSFGVAPGALPGGLGTPPGAPIGVDVTPISPVTPVTPTDITPTTPLNDGTFGVTTVVEPGQNAPPASVIFWPFGIIVVQAPVIVPLEQPAP